MSKYRNPYKRTAAALIVAAGAGLWMHGHAEAADKTAFGCSKLELDTTLPSIEGKDGFFFRILADLRMQHPMTDEMIGELADLSAALEKNGTTLIYLPVPTKSQVLPDMLPRDAELYGFDRKVAQEIYTDTIERLRKRGVVTVDLMSAMQTAKPGDPAFYKADFHWTSRGAQLAAEAIGKVVKAAPAYAEVSPLTFETIEKGPAKAYSTMRRALQRHCRENLPEVTTMAYETMQVDAADASQDIFGSDSAAEAIALVGTSYSDSEVPNFSGFLSQYTGLGVSNQSITGGNQFGSITSYLTSKSFVEQRPRFLIWENPIYNNLAQYGLAPLTELVTAASAKCEAVPATALHRDKERLRIDVANMSLDAKTVLFADAGDEGSRKVEVELHRSNGEVRTERIERNARIAPSGRFYLPVEPIWAADISHIVMTFDRLVPEQAAVSVCKQEG